MEPQTPLPPDETPAQGSSNGKRGRQQPVQPVQERSDPAGQGGLRVARFYTTAGVDPYDTVEWEARDALITNEKGEPVFEQRGVEVPKSWSQTAANVVVSKYFRGQMGSPQRERSVRQLIGRVADTIARWGRAGGYFATEEDAAAFHAELTHILLYQIACFNSPVWFNVGIEDKPQCSACFINSVEDTMQSILTLAKTEGMLFKYGSGTGSNLSRLRSSRELLAGGGTASGPVSFMKGFDAFAGVIKSGGKTRRAAKMVILDVDHPDIADFIRCKEVEERKAWALIEAGYSGGFNVVGGAYDSIAYQNANHSVRVTDAFMEAVLADREWQTTARTSGEPMGTFRARGLMQMIASSTWACGDPGMQFDTTINDWHTCAATGRISASNPCSEYMFLDDTACNLASLNLMRFYEQESGFDVAGFRHACEVVITAQEILVDNASYPTERIDENSHKFRPLGLGYANLGALLMARGVPYDSEGGRDYAAALTALMSGAAYCQSARVAAALGPFSEFATNAQPMMRVMRKHREAVKRIDPAHAPLDLLQAGKRAWDEVVDLGDRHGLRNSQISVLAPTGTIAFMMDCDTTGVEPDIALVKYKKLVGGGMIKIVNTTVPRALKRLGYDKEQVREIIEFIDEHDTIEGAPHLKSEHLPVFDCAFKAAQGSRSIHYMGHLRMLGAVQPFISGAISKTINMPEDSTPDEILQAYIEGWRMGLKAVAIYRDGCKRSQPLSTRRDQADGTRAPDQPDMERAGGQAPAHAAARSATAAPAPPAPVAATERRAVRRKLSDERRAITHKFSINEHEGYLTVGLYEDGQPGEIFLVMAKEGSTISGLMDSFATSISIALQYGVPLQTLVDKFSHTRFEPSGFTKNPEIPIAKSITDYIFRWLASKFLSREGKEAAGVILRDSPPSAPATSANVANAANAGAEGEARDAQERPGARSKTAAAEPKAAGTVDSKAAVAAWAGGSLPLMGGGRLEPVGQVSNANPQADPPALAVTPFGRPAFLYQQDAPSCHECGAIMVRNGSCYKCLNCGSTSGCS
ncbi:MAG TPA: vitamin B12-dependent ribonucleotide reductase [Thermoanaerobaculia bacterium]|nr:vitamin B12-dependent ribonucleotide reductase [Thermoanaerobaculia bacterium]